MIYLKGFYPAIFILGKLASTFISRNVEKKEKLILDMIIQSGKFPITDIVIESRSNLGPDKVQSILSKLAREKKIYRVNGHCYSWDDRPNENWKGL